MYFKFIPAYCPGIFAFNVDLFKDLFQYLASTATTTVIPIQLS